MTAPGPVRRRTAVFLSLLLVGPGTVRTVTAQAPAAAQRVVAVVTTVERMDEALPFYLEVLEFEMVSDVEVADPNYDRLTGIFASRVRIATLALGPDTIELTDFITPEGRSSPRPVRSNDLWFQHLALVVTDIEAATERLRGHGVRLISAAPQRFPDGRAFLYFEDPDGHPLELAEFPGEALARPGKLFQRIDHTALVVADLDAAIDFYRRLGFELEDRFISGSEAQQRLNDVPGARLEIATLKLRGDGLGVELLYYASPRDGRPYPPDTRPNDSIHRRTVVGVQDAQRWYDSLGAAAIDMCSPEVAEFETGPLARRVAFLIADPTGHVLEIRSRR